MKSQQHDRVVKSTVNVIKIISIQNLLVPFCCVVEKDTLWHFPLLGSLSNLF